MTAGPARSPPPRFPDDIPPSLVTCRHPGPVDAGAELPVLTATAQTAGGTAQQLGRVSWFASDGPSPEAPIATATTGLGGGSGDLQPELRATGLLRAGQDYADSVVVHNVGVTTAFGPTTIHVPDDPERRVSGAGWTCLGLTCTHPGDLAPGEALPTLTVVGTTPALDYGAATSSSGLLLQNARDSSREDHSSNSTSRPLALPAVNLSLLVRPVGPFEVEGTVPVEVRVTNTGQAADSGGARVSTGRFYDILSGTGQDWSCSPPDQYGGGPCTYGLPVPAGGEASPLTVQVRTRSGALDDPRYPLDLLAVVYHPQDAYRDDSDAVLHWPLVPSTTRVRAWGAPEASGAVTVTFDQPVDHLTPAVVALASDANQPVPATLTCSPGPCFVGPVTAVRLTPTGRLEPGAGLRPVVAPPITPAVVIGPRYRVGRTVEDRQATQTWGTVADPRALGGRYARERTVNATFTGAFTGTGIRLWWMTGPDRGLARVLVDGRVVGSIDQYAARTGRLSKAYAGFAPGTHRIQVVVTGAKRAASTGTFVTVDGLSPVGASCSSGCEAPGAYAWRAATSAAATDRVVVATSTPASMLSQRFTGTGVDVRYLRSSSAGSFHVYVDGRRVSTLSARTAAAGLARYRVGGLAQGSHLVQLVAVGNGTVAVDRFEVL